MTTTSTSRPSTPVVEPILRLRGIGKEFFGNSVLRGIDLDVRPGEVHALVGENGAGKSTLMKIIAGVHRPDAGTMTLDDAPATFTSPLAAQVVGVSTVFQEFNLLPERTVAENVYLGREPRRFGLVDAARMDRDTSELLTELGLVGISPWMRVGSLSVAEQQIVEIVKAVSYDARIISMDEPTAALADQEVELLYELVRRLKERGVAILYVSHRLKEIFDLCDTITVLKDGNQVITTATADITPDQLVRTMVGREFSGYFPEKDPTTVPGEVRLALQGVGNTQVDDVTLEVRSGEIVALAGLQGSGRTEIAHGIFGIAPFSRGRVLIDGTEHTLTSARQAVRAGLALVTEDRKAEGLALGQSILANARLVLDSVTPRTSGSRARRIPGILSSLDLVARSAETEVQYLSGGNQQKVVLAKWLVTDPDVIVLDEPTRGIDVGAKRAVYDLMRELTADGVAVLLISSELPEVVAMADRILVMRDGRLAGELPAGSDEETVMSLATGAGEESAEHVAVDLSVLAEHPEALAALPGASDAAHRPGGQPADRPVQQEER
ncbi:sugar ABC transporter ATP-binding protein [Oerskovia flava]|uniref:sugar ABC transporter ATP-binding protein n=1 Tax=Oerskovia flava TaxID=2986422 RepID=UPI00223F929E|nr:sugar ABC transporter ATP-binding protein [Oerskovia sp. JB1-3-2]